MVAALSHEGTTTAVTRTITTSASSGVMLVQPLDADERAELEPAAPGNR
jgi:hypothetical protein